MVVKTGAGQVQEWSGLTSLELVSRKRDNVDKSKSLFLNILSFSLSGVVSFEKFWSMEVFVIDPGVVR